MIIDLLHCRGEESMGAFERTYTDLQRFDFALLRDGPVILYDDRAELDKACTWLRKHDYTSYLLNCKQWRSSGALHEDFYSKVASALSIADCDDDRDAFRDCLYYLEVPAKGGVVIVFSNYDLFVGQSPRHAHDILDIIAEISRFNLLFGRRLLVLVHSKDPHLTLEPVGGRPVLPTHWKPDL
jgi:hypothetical protein